MTNAVKTDAVKMSSQSRNFSAEKHSNVVVMGVSLKAKAILMTTAMALQGIVLGGVLSIAMAPGAWAQEGALDVSDPSVMVDLSVLNDNGQTPGAGVSPAPTDLSLPHRMPGAHMPVSRLLVQPKKPVVITAPRRVKPRFVFSTAPATPPTPTEAAPDTITVEPPKPGEKPAPIVLSDTPKPVAPEAPTSVAAPQKPTPPIADTPKMTASAIPPAPSIAKAPEPAPLPEPVKAPAATAKPSKAAATAPAPSAAPKITALNDTAPTVQTPSVQPPAPPNPPHVTVPESGVSAHPTPP